jgi:hypothetical protein
MPRKNVLKGKSKKGNSSFMQNRNLGVEESLGRGWLKLSGDCNKNTT